MVVSILSEFIGVFHYFLIKLDTYSFPAFGELISSCRKALAFSVKENSGYFTLSLIQIHMTIEKQASDPFQLHVIH